MHAMPPLLHTTTAIVKISSNIALPLDLEFVSLYIWLQPSWSTCMFLDDCKPTSCTCQARQNLVVRTPSLTSTPSSSSANRQLVATIIHIQPHGGIYIPQVVKEPIWSALCHNHVVWKEFGDEVEFIVWARSECAMRLMLFDCACARELHSKHAHASSTLRTHVTRKQHLYLRGATLWEPWPLFGPSTHVSDLPAAYQQLVLNRTYMCVCKRHLLQKIPPFFCCYENKSCCLKSAKMLEGAHVGS
jgi:hypothetical protein